ncbi:hypothetical protein [Kitasatospora sp. NBC_01300]|uniref:hypothetical protein n=1 Tax=Kitasatospora sp. NBC_01300 TaxID=2903574 RepID=UPI00352EFA68|nr:hypothetical protein OG556_01025 [Kitasatospora sp. NBC_01300]WSK08233.1 hypothetical protein OG556_32695 [Kitasatospora sp. NBC_01300]
MTTTPPRDYPHPVTVEIGGVTRTATFTRLADALTAVRTALARLPLDDDHAAYLADLFAPESTARIARRLTDFGALRTIAFVGTHAHPIHLRPAESHESTERPDGPAGGIDGLPDPA